MTPLFTPLFLFFFFNATATTDIYTLSLHDALPISAYLSAPFDSWARLALAIVAGLSFVALRSEEHTSELQSLTNLVCRLLLEKKKEGLLSRLERIEAETGLLCN